MVEGQLRDSIREYSEISIIRKKLSVTHVRSYYHFIDSVSNTVYMFGSLLVSRLKSDSVWHY